MEAIIILGIALLSQAVKKYIYPSYGSGGVHCFVFAVAMLITSVWYVANQTPQFMEILQQAGIILIATVGLYEVVLKKIGFSSIHEQLK